MDTLTFLRYCVYVGMAAVAIGLLGLLATGVLAWRQFQRLRQLADEVHEQHQIVTPIGPGSELVTTSEERFREHQERVVTPRVKVLSQRIGLIPIVLMWSLRLCGVGVVATIFGLIGHFMLSR